MRHRETGDLEAARKLIVSNLKFVVRVANEYKNYNVNTMDLIQEGNIGLMKAVRGFDPTKGYRLISYAVWWIRAYNTKPHNEKLESGKSRNEPVPEKTLLQAEVNKKQD